MESNMSFGKLIDERLTELDQLRKYIRRIESEECREARSERTEFTNALENLIAICQAIVHEASLDAESYKYKMDTSSILDLIEGGK